MSKDIYRYFRIEARELIDGLAQGALALEQEPDHARVSPLLRLAHTLKGAARVVKRGAIADQAHALEELLIPLRDQPRRATVQEVSACLALVDGMRRELDALDAAPAAAASAGGGVVAAITPAAELARAVRIDSQEASALVEGLASASRRVFELTASLEGLQTMGGPARSLAALLAFEAGTASATASPWRAAELATMLASRIDSSQRLLQEGLQGLGREVTDLRQRVERLQLMALSTLFDALQRVARDAAQMLGRQVQWVSEGGEIGIDTAVLAVLAEALPHMVRNTVAHGIEAPAQRRAAGKPEQGLVRLRCTRRGNRVTLALSDDGQGLDLEAVRAAARERGLVAADQPLDDTAATALLLRGGLSTSATVSTVSGRGVGLDVVREAMERLRGDLSMTTRRGQGTTVELQVPVSLSSARALLAQAERSVVAVPLEAVRSTVRATAQQIIATATGEALVHEGRTVPLVALANLIGARPLPRDVAARRLAMVLHAGGAEAAIDVEALLGTSEITVQPFPPGVAPVAVLAGVGVDEAGSPQLVLDVAAAVAAVRAWVPGVAASVQTATRRQPILVIDDSLTTRTLEQSILESAGYEVDVAVSAEEALAKAAAVRYGLFVVDVEMPGMDGFTFVERTRADPVQRQVPAILVTSLSSAQARERGHQVGAIAFIVKAEFDQRILLDLIRGILG